jgi:hypothetical protein
MNNMNNQPERISAMRFHTQNTNGILVTIDKGDIIQVEKTPSVRIVGTFKITKAEMTELSHSITMNELRREATAKMLEREAREQKDTV